MLGTIFLHLLSTSSVYSVLVRMQLDRLLSPCELVAVSAPLGVLGGALVGAVYAQLFREVSCVGTLFELIV